MKILLAALTLLWVVSFNPASAVGLTSQDLRTLMLKDTGQPQADQYFSIGPMHDGRTIRIKMSFASETAGISIRPVANGQYVIRFSRTAVLTSIFVTDAMLVCARFRQEVCPFMAAYLEKLGRATDLASMPFLDEALPEMAARVAETRADDTIYKPSLSQGIQNTIVVAAMHEVGHVALHHLEGSGIPSRETILRQEAEADGFAVGILQIANVPSQGGVVLLMTGLLYETLPDQVVTSHPPAICRMAAFASDAYDWVIKNSPSLSLQSDDSARNALVDHLLKSFQRETADELMGLSDLKGCGSYAQAFATGILGAKSLIDSETPITSTGPE